jgi:hypothetical protein
VEASTAAAGARPAALAVSATTPAGPPLQPGRTPALTRVQGAASHLVPYVQYQVARLGLAGQVGLAALTAAVVIAVGTLLPAQDALQTLGAELTRARHAPAVTSTDQAVPRLIASLPTRAQMPLVIGQFAAEAKAAGVSLETGRYVYTAPKGGSIARYDLEFPVKASYPDIRTFIDHALTAVPAAALGKLRVERKAVGDAVVNADIDFVVFVRSGEQP